MLVALTDEDSPRVLLGRRAMHLRLHPGEVAFPGGKREPEDATPWADGDTRGAGGGGSERKSMVHPLGELHP